MTMSESPTSTSPRRPIRIGNASGFYGDRLSAFEEMAQLDDLDAITGDYLAELTMLILWKARNKDPEAGYARTFLTQARRSLADCAKRNIKIVVNAGGLNPSGLATQIRAFAAEEGIDVTIAHIEGDNIAPRIGELQASGQEFRHLDKNITLADAKVNPVSANAYLGGWGIAAALAAGADVVICPRVTDAALVVGLSAWWHGWSRTDFDALAGAVVAGHIIECGPQATGGNYSWIHEISDRRYPGSPIAEICHDGSCVITKSPATGGLVSVGTVTAQLLYEIDSPLYLNPDVASHFDTVRLEQQGPDRVSVSGTQGTAPPSDLKVAMNYIGGYRNTMTLVLTGLDIEEKAHWATESLFELLGGTDQFESIDAQLLRYDTPDPETAAQATAHLRVTVKDSDRARVDRAFSGAVTELAVANYAGLHTTTPPSPATEFGVYWPTLIPATDIEQVLVLADGRRLTIEHTDKTEVPTPPAPIPTSSEVIASSGSSVRRPFGDVVATRSGDKGGKANVGVWTDTEERWEWLRGFLDVYRFRTLVPETRDLVVQRYELANLRALNFVVVGFLGDGVSSSSRPDSQAKSLGEFLRARYVELPASLLAQH